MTARWRWRSIASPSCSTKLAGKTVNLNVTDATTPVRICDGDDAGFLAVLTPTSGDGS